jgi:hypothetical protein
MDTKALLIADIKAVAWTNHARRFSDKTLMQPHTALVLFSMLSDEHYPVCEAAADSMVSVASSLNIPLRLWRTQRALYFFAHASLNAEELGCVAVASHHPCTA